MATIQLSLPDELARDANELGLLESKTLAEVIRKEIRRLHAEELLSAANRMAALGGESMSPEEVEQEIRTARAADHAAGS